MPLEHVSSWIKHHPNLQPSFYQNLEVPKNIKDAELRMQCAKQAVVDIDLQLVIVNQEIDLERVQENPYNENKVDDFNEHKLKLLKAKRYHNNAANAYWYYMQVAVG
jgi:hypothetical protein